jgi:glucosylceramidase
MFSREKKLFRLPTKERIMLQKTTTSIFTSCLICCFAIFTGNNAHCQQKSNSIEYWLTKPDQSVLLQKQPAVSFSDQKNDHSFISVDPQKTFQQIDGFGFALTGGSAWLINGLEAAKKKALLNELFGHAENAIGISYIRISIGASDLDSVVFSYDDMPKGQTDVELKKFSLTPDKANLMPVLKQILAINPKIKILGSPWSPPEWMKDNENSKGGELLPKYYAAYANYFVKYIQQMKANGIAVDAVTVQNEPENPKNNPSLSMNALQQADFVKNNLGPAFKKAGIKTKIIIFDHNCDHPEYPITILNDKAAGNYIDGSAFHLYVGEVEAMSTVHEAHPDKSLYFTEQWTGAKGKFEHDFKWAIKNVIIGTMRNWSRNALEWNLASDPEFDPHTPGGCTECKGAVTIGNNNDVKRNVSYYIIAHASKFVPAGSVRIASTMTEGLANVAFKTPAGKIAMIVLNENKTATDFNISYKGKQVAVNIPADAVATFTW